MITTIDDALVLPRKLANDQEIKDYMFQLN
jgi:hypothetical protein